MRFVSVCSGIEAASVAWAPLGWEALVLAEIEPYPAALLAYRFGATRPRVMPDPDEADISMETRMERLANIKALDRVPYWGNKVVNQGDFTTLKDHPELIGDADILCGGTPCQSFSYAGKRGGLLDPRGNLSLEFIILADAIDAIRLERGLPPAIIFWENVPGVLSSDNAFGCFLGAMVGADAPLTLRRGQRWTDSGLVVGPQRTAAWRILDAQYLGLAQRRERVFVVSSARTDFDPAAVLFEPEGVRRYSPPSRSKGEGSTHAVAPSLTASGRGVERTGDTRGQDTVVAVDAGSQRAAFGGNDTRGPIDIATARLSANTSKRTGKSTSDVRAGSGIGEDGDPMFTLQAGAQHGVAFKPSHFTRGKDGAPSDIFPPLSADADKGDQDPVVLATAYSMKDALAPHGSLSGSEELALPIKASDFKEPQVVISDHEVLATLDANYGKLQGASGQDANHGHSHLLVSYNLSPGSGSDGAPSAVETDVAPALTTVAEADKNGRGLHVIDHAYPIHPNALRGDSKAKTPSPDAEGKVRLRDPGLGIGGDGDPADTLTAAGPGAVAFSMRGRDGAPQAEAEPEDRAPALRAVGGSASHVNVATDLAVRRITMVEAETLQGFPPNWTLIPWPSANRKAEDAAETAAYLLSQGVPEEDLEWAIQTPDGPRYKAIGNSWAVTVARLVGQRIQAELERANGKA